MSPKLLDDSWESHSVPNDDISGAHPRRGEDDGERRVRDSPTRDPAEPGAAAGVGSRWIRVLRPQPTALTVFGVLLTAFIIAGVMIGESLVTGDSRGSVGFFAWAWDAPEWVGVTHVMHALAVVEVVTMLLVALRWVYGVEPGSAASRALCMLLVGCVLVAGTVAVSKHALLRRQAFDVRDDWHYFLGTKYFAELGYDHLYECAAVSEIVQGKGFGDPERRTKKNSVSRLRNLRTNKTFDLRRIEDSEKRQRRCIDRFSPDRWREFGSDVSQFRQWLEPWGNQWPRMFRDHGYNGPPVLTVILSALANRVPVEYGSLTRLGLINLGLVTAMLLAAIWAFGWEAAAVFAVTLFASTVEGFGHAMSVPRYMWLSALIIGICLLHRQRYGASGVALVVSASLKGFPAVFLLAALVHVAVQLHRRGHLRDLGTWRPLRFVIAAAVTSAVLFVVTLATHHGLDDWAGFLHQMKLDGGRPNGMSIGFFYNFGYPETATFAPIMMESLDHTLIGIPVRYIAWAFAGGLVIAVGRHATWLRGSTLTLALGFTAFHTCTIAVRYYYAGFVGLPLLFADGDHKGAWRGLVIYLLALDVAGKLIFPHVKPMVLYTSLLSTGLTGLVTGVLFYLEHQKRARVRPRVPDTSAAQVDA